MRETARTRKRTHARAHTHTHAAHADALGAQRCEDEDEDEEEEDEALMKGVGRADGGLVGCAHVFICTWGIYIYSLS